MDITKAIKILNVRQSASINEIKSAFQKLSLKHHPDKNKNAASKVDFIQIKKAYDYLLYLKDYNASEFKTHKQPLPNEIQLGLTLEEIFTGCTKKEKIVCKVVDQNGIEKLEEKVLNVVIKPGVLTGARITIDQKGDRHHGEIPANVVFTVYDKPHEIFKRDRFDLKYTAIISVKEAILGCKLAIPTLDNDKVSLTINEPITQESVKRIQNRGFPYPDSSNKRGDLVVAFCIIENVQSIEYDLSLTLSQIMFGCIKNVKIKRKIITLNGIEKSEDKILSIKVKPGTECGTKISFPNEGDQMTNGKRADIDFIIRDKPDETLKRDGENIIYTALITLDDSLKGASFTIPAIESDPIKLIIDGPINQDGYRIINRGLPYQNDNSKRGDFVIYFKISQKCTTTKKELFLTLEEIFSGCSKKISHKRKILDKFGVTKVEDVILTVKVDPGVEDGTEIVLRQKGDGQHGKIDADLVLIVRDKAHEIFKRNRADIEYKAKLIPNQVIEGKIIEIPTLQNTVKQLVIDETINEHSVKRIKGHGLPFQYDFKKRGDILVHFEFISEQKISTFVLNNNSITNSIRNNLFMKSDNEKKIHSPKPQQFGISNDNIFGNKNKSEKLASIGTSSKGVFENHKSEEAKPKIRPRPSLNSKELEKPLKKPPIEQEISLSLENVFTGVDKKVIVYRKMEIIGHVWDDPKEFCLKIKPGVANGTRFTFEQEGHKSIKAIPGDVVFIIKEEPHPHFKRINQFDIEYVSMVDLDNVGNEIEIEIPTIENDPIFLTFERDYFNENTMEIFTGRGLPKGYNKERGDLIISFNIIDKVETKRPHLKQEITKNQPQKSTLDPKELQKPAKNLPIEHDIFLTQEEVLTGCTKQVKVGRKMEIIGKEWVDDKTFSVIIKPGVATDTQITFEQEGHRSLKALPGDVVFTIKHKGKQLFKRINQSDIEYVARIDLGKMRNCEGYLEVTIPTLENDTITLTLDENDIYENTVETFTGRGLPRGENKKDRGNLVVRFEMDSS